MIESLTDNIVRKQLAGLVADAEALLTVVAHADLPAGLRIVNVAGGSLLGFSLRSGHGFAQAHGFRPGTVAVGVAAETILRCRLNCYGDDLDDGLWSAGLRIEYIAAHETAHALACPTIDCDPQPVDVKAMRLLPTRVEKLPPTPASRTAEGHDAPWAAALVILAGRCRKYRPQSRHRWPELLKDDLDAVGIDAQAVADAVGDVADELPLRELLAPGAALVERVAEAIPDHADRVALIESRETTSAADPGHVAQAVAGDPL